jgi:tRNA 5-methylaminomethyl-2-thiouridine biosynthesis bifunctional protein
MTSAHLQKFESVKTANIEWRNNLPFSTEFNDVYFSIHGAIEESQHVFINGNHLLNDWKTKQQTSFIIAELGFGSGLNFLNTAKHWHEHLSNTCNPSNITNEHCNNSHQQHLHYIAIEKRPFTLSDLKKTYALWPELSTYSNVLIKYYPSPTYGRHQIIFKQWNLTLTLMLMPLEDAFDDLMNESQSQQNKITVDHWFLDGFSPTKNSTMWGEKNASNIASLSKEGTRLATYSVAAAVKKPLTESGFTIIKRKGFAKKREMLTAVLENKPTMTQTPKFINIKHETPWFNLSSSSNAESPENKKNKKIAIIGAGIAGCTMAYNLSLKGFHCEIFESSSDIAYGASAAAAGLFHPQLSTDMNINSQFNWQAYLSLLRFINDLPDKVKSKIIINQGINRFLKDHKATEQLLELAKRLSLSKWVNNGDILAGKKSINFPHAAVLNIPAYCRLLLDLIPSHQLTLHTNTEILSIEKNNLEKNKQQWKLKLKGKQPCFDHVVFCVGANSQLLKQAIFTSTNDITNISRGQTCFIESQKLAAAINNPLCEQSYIIPKGNDQFHLGATFERQNDLNFDNKALSLNSQKKILSQTSAFLKSASLPYLNSDEIRSFELKGTVGYRLHSLDRMPLVGGLFDQKKLKNDFNKLGQVQLLRKNMSHYNKGGLWINTAYGSHGLLYSFLASQHLTALINNELSPLQTKISNALNPARFFIKELKASTKK